METLDQKIRKTAATSGLLFGIISLVIGIFVFYFVTSMTTNVWMVTIIGPIGIGVLIPLAVAVWLVVDLRKKIGGFWNFKQATTGIFIMFFVGYLVSTLGNLGFSKVIEPDMVSKMKTVYVGATTEMMKKQGADQDAIDKQTASVSAKFEDTQSPGKLAKGLLIAVIFDFVGALIFAAIFKRNPLLSIEEIEKPAAAKEDLDPTE